MGFTITTPQISALVMHACCDHLGRYISLRDFQMIYHGRRLFYISASLSHSQLSFSYPSTPNFGMENYHHSSAIFIACWIQSVFILIPSISLSIPIFLFFQQAQDLGLFLILNIIWVIYCTILTYIFGFLKGKRKSKNNFQNSLTIAFHSRKFQKIVGNKIFWQPDIYFQTFELT